MLTKEKGWRKRQLACQGEEEQDRLGGRSSIQLKVRPKGYPRGEQVKICRDKVDLMNNHLRLRNWRWIIVENWDDFRREVESVPFSLEASIDFTNNRTPSGIGSASWSSLESAAWKPRLLPTPTITLPARLLQISMSLMNKWGNLKEVSILSPSYLISGGANRNQWSSPPTIKWQQNGVIESQFISPAHVIMGG